LEIDRVVNPEAMELTLLQHTPVQRTYAFIVNAWTIWKASIVYRDLASEVPNPAGYYDFHPSVLAAD